jgi:hypothetical protein
VQLAKKIEDEARLWLAASNNRLAGLGPAQGCDGRDVAQPGLRIVYFFQFQQFFQFRVALGLGKA